MTERVPYPVINYDFDVPESEVVRHKPPEKTDDELCREAIAEVIKLYPRIAERIMRTWGHVECDRYLNGLIIDDRGNRQGFPRHVAAALVKLSLIHTKRYGSFNENKDKWIDTNYR